MLHRLLAFLLTLSAAAGIPPAPHPSALALSATQPSATQTPAPSTTPEELPRLEDALARAVSSTRVAAHLHPLAHLPARRSLRRIVCSSAFDNRPRTALITAESEADSAVLELDPAPLLAGGPLPPSLRRVAEYDDRSTAHGRRITRVSVAAFRSPSDPRLAWAAITLYWSRPTEYFAIHFTRTFYPMNLDGPIPNGPINPACVNLP